MDSILKSVLCAGVFLAAQLSYASGNCLVTSHPVFKRQLAYDALNFLNNLGVKINNSENKETTLDTFSRKDLFNKPRSTLIGIKTMGPYMLEAVLVSFSLVKEFTRTFPQVERRAFVYRVEYTSIQNQFGEKCSDTGKVGKRFVDQIESVLIID
jgi:hypothetical protein